MPTDRSGGFLIFLTIGQPKLLTAPELAHALGVSLSTVEKLTSRRLIPCLRFGRSVRYDLADVIAARRQGTMQERVAQDWARRQRAW